MDKKIRINIQVGETYYPLWVDMDEEPLFREAARMVNRRLIAYSTKFRGANLSPEAFLAMSAVDLAVMCQKHLQRSDAEAVASDLTSIVDDLQQFVQTEEQ